MFSQLFLKMIRKSATVRDGYILSDSTPLFLVCSLTCWRVVDPYAVAIPERLECISIGSEHVPALECILPIPCGDHCCMSISLFFRDRRRKKPEEPVRKASRIECYNSECYGIECYGSRKQGLDPRSKVSTLPLQHVKLDLSTALVVQECDNGTEIPIVQTALVPRKDKLLRR